MDHHVVENYAVGNSRIFSTEDWSATGDAAVFTDPFYSPGSDFIALANGYITELIAAGAGEAKVRQYQRHFQAFYQNTISLYRGQYAGFGDRDLMAAKLLWDYAFYWSIVAKLYFSRQYLDLAFMRENETNLLRAAALHAGVQHSFRRRARDARRSGGEGRFYDYHDVALFHELQADLLNGAQVQAGDSIRKNLAHLESVRAEVETALAQSAAGGRGPSFGKFLGAAAGRV